MFMIVFAIIIVIAFAWIYFEKNFYNKIGYHQSFRGGGDDPLSALISPFLFLIPGIFLSDGVLRYFFLGGIIIYIISLLIIFLYIRKSNINDANKYMLYFAIAFIPLGIYALITIFILDYFNL